MIRAAALLTAIAEAGLLAACSAGASEKRAPAADGVAGTARVIAIEAPALAERLASRRVQLIDVRTPEEFAEGHIKGAINIPLDRFDPARLPGTGGEDIVLYCRSDRRSGIAAEKLASATGTAAVHLEGGILAWEAARQPIER